MPRTVVKGVPRTVDTCSVEYELSNPTRQQVRNAVLSGIIADSAAVPVLVSLVFVHREPFAWGYLLAGLGSLAVSVVYLAALTLRRGGALDAKSQADIAFVVICCALLALSFAELASGTRYGLYRPVVFVIVVMVGIIGDRRMRLTIGILAIGSVVWTSWVEGLRGGTLAVTDVIYATAITVVTVLIARTVRSFAGMADSRDGMAALSDVLSEARSLEEGFVAGLPLVADVLPCSQVAVVLRDAESGRTEPVATWPPPAGAARRRSDSGGPRLARSDAVERAFRSDAIVVDPDVCAIPIGYTERGPLVLALLRKATSKPTGLLPEEAAEFVGAAFLRVSSRAAFVANLRLESMTDPLTGLANRRSLVERLSGDMARASRSGLPVSVAMVDLDRFKEYNDRHGHLAGDTVLRAVAALMVSKLRRQDLVARYGGEEFCLVLPDTDLRNAVRLLDAIRLATGELAGGAVTLSAGITQWDGSEGVTSVVNRADHALYQAKHRGRDQVVAIDAYLEA